MFFFEKQRGHSFFFFFLMFFLLSRVVFPSNRFHTETRVCVRSSCLQAGMFALRERRQHVTQEDFEMAVSKVMKSLWQKRSWLFG